MRSFYVVIVAIGYFGLHGCIVEKCVIRDAEVRESIVKVFPKVVIAGRNQRIWLVAENDNYTDEIYGELLGERKKMEVLRPIGDTTFIYGVEYNVTLNDEGWIDGAALKEMNAIGSASILVMENDYSGNKWESHHNEIIAGEEVETDGILVELDRVPLKYFEIIAQTARGEIVGFEEPCWEVSLGQEMPRVWNVTAVIDPCFYGLTVLNA